MLHHHLLAAPEQHLQAAGFILRGIRGVLAIIGSVIAGVICAFVAKSKGYTSTTRLDGEPLAGHKALASRPRSPQPGSPKPPTVGVAA